MASDAVSSKVPDRGHLLMARMDRIPVWSLPAGFLVIIGLGYFFTFYDITDIGFAMPAIAPQFHLTGSETLFVALSIGLIGYILGSYVIGTLADRYGRFNTMLLTMALTALGSFGDATATGIISLTVWRFITGMGVGADLNLVSTYIGEFAPPHKRGRISVLTFLIGIIGQAITPFVALAFVPTFTYGWRLLFVVGGIIAVIALVVRFQLPESPRWLVLHGNLDKAEKIISEMEERATKKGAELLEARTQVFSTEGGKYPTKYLFQRHYAKRLVLLVLMWFFWYIGNYGFLGDAATLLSNQGVTISSSISFLAVGAVGYPIGAVIMMGVADKVERKFLIFGDTIVWLIGMILFGFLHDETLIVLGSFLASLSLGMYLQVAYTFTAESYPTRARSSGFALSDGLGHIGGAFGALAVPIFVTMYGFQSGFAIIGVTGLIAGLLALAGPSTSKLRLEQISD